MVEVDGEEVEIGAADVMVRRTEREGHLFEIRRRQRDRAGHHADAGAGGRGPRPRNGEPHPEPEEAVGLRRHRQDNDLHQPAAISPLKAFDLYAEHIKSETLAVSIDRTFRPGARRWSSRSATRASKVVLERLK